jgi:glycosyltransferase involved in cell wall biosynthesis
MGRLPGSGRRLWSSRLSGLRFAMVTTFYPPYSFGGDGIGILRLSRALVRRGHQVTVIYDAGAYGMLAGRLPSLKPFDDGVELVTLRSRLGTLSCLLTQQTGRPVVHGTRIARVLDEGQFDVINFHNVSLVGGPGVLRAGRAVKLYMAHDHWLVCPTHALWRHGREVCTGRECLRCVARYRRPPQLWRYTGYLQRELRHVDAFIAPSEFSRAKHREFGFPRDMEVVPYFVPDADPAPANAGAPPHDRPYFLFVGRLEKIKGLDDVIPVFRDYSDADLLIAGDGTYGETLRRLAADVPRVKFVGWVAPEELGCYYAHAVALIVPSVCFETFGIVIIEAFRHGTPVVARRIGSFPEIVERAGGELFWTPDELLAAMRRLQAEPGRRERLGHAAFEAVGRHWSERAVVPQYLDVVRRAAVEKGATRVVDLLRAGG